MKTVVMALLLTFLIPAVSLAGIVKGTLWYKNKPMGKGVRIEVRHGSSLYSTVTDEHGRFRLIVGEVGACTLTVRGNNQAPQTRIVSRKTTVHYELELYYRDGQYGLREKD